MSRRELLRPTHAAFLKKAVGLLVLVVLGYAGYCYLLMRRPPLPERGADIEAFQYLLMLRSHNYPAAYAFASQTAQTKTTPTDMANTCGQVYTAIDGWQLGQPKYSITHMSASVPVVLRYRPAWAIEEPQTLRGKRNFRLENGSWRLIVALPFVTAILKQREDQHFGG